MRRAIRVSCQILKWVLLAGLLAWVCATPLAWILRDGLGPDMVESRGFRSVSRFLVGWGLPALLLAVPLIVLTIAERRLGAVE